MRLSLQKNKEHRILLLFAGVMVMVMGIMAYAVPPAIDSDSGWGFAVMRNMELGNHFNLLIYPNPNNIAENRAEFLTWWTPGQYFVPYVFKILLKISTGQAVAVAMISCYLAGLAGFYKLFTQLGFTKWVAAISIVFIVTQYFFINQFVYYRGGELVLFSFVSWFLYGCFRVKKVTWQVLVLMFIAGLVGFFSKSSFLWIYAAGITCIWISISINQTVNTPPSQTGTDNDKPFFNKRIRVWLLNGVLLALPFICALGAIYIFFLSKGPNPTTETGQILIRPETFAFPLASPIVAGFSVDELFNGLIDRTLGELISYHFAIVLLLVLAICSIAFIIRMVKFSTDRKYAIAMLVTYVFGVIFFSYMFIRQANISYEARHFRIIGLLATPGIIYLLFKTKISKAFFFIVWIVIASMVFRYFAGEYRANIRAPRSISGFSQPRYDNATLSEIAKIDKQHANNAIFVIMEPNVTTEIKNSRVIIIDADDMTRNDFSELKYNGKAGPVYIIMRAKYVENGISASTTKSFTAYHQFASKKLSNNYYLFSAVN